MAWLVDVMAPVAQALAVSPAAAAAVRVCCCHRLVEGAAVATTTRPAAAAYKLQDWLSGGLHALSQVLPAVVDGCGAGTLPPPPGCRDALLRLWLCCTLALLTNIPDIAVTAVGGGAVDALVESVRSCAMAAASCGAPAEAAAVPLIAAVARTVAALEPAGHDEDDDEGAQPLYFADGAGSQRRGLDQAIRLASGLRGVLFEVSAAALRPPQRDGHSEDSLQVGLIGALRAAAADCGLGVEGSRAPVAKDSDGCAWQCATCAAAASQVLIELAGHVELIVELRAGSEKH